MPSVLGKNVLVRRVSTWVFWVIWGASLALSIFFIVFPYYFGLGQYLPKSDPSLGYFLPKSEEAWFFLILGVALLVFSFLVLVLFLMRRKDENGKTRWVTHINMGPDY